jgi:iron complex transport system substrate-binding protein
LARNVTRDRPSGLVVLHNNGAFSASACGRAMVSFYNDLGVKPATTT